jgi:hypothetical protein
MPRKFVIAAKFPKKDPAFITYTEAIILAWTGNTVVPNPPVTIPAMTALYNVLTAAQALAVKRGAGAATARNTAREHVEVALRQWESYAEGLLAAMAPADAVAALATLGFFQKKAGVHTKQDQAIEEGKLTGEGELNLKAVGRHGTVQYCVQYSINGGVAWLDWPPSLETKIVITGLPVGVVVWFQWRTLIKGVYGNWSQTLKMLIK